MIIKLTGANFSANNIGTIQLNRVVTTDTLALLTHYSRVLTKEQQLAVQDFVFGLKDSNLWDSIENLYIPALASNVGETLYDIKGDAVDAIPTETYYEMYDGGLRAVGLTGTAVAVDDINIAKVPVNGSYMDIHYMTYTGAVSMSDTTLSDMPIVCNSSGVYKGMNFNRVIGADTFTSYLSGSESYGVQSIAGSTNTLGGFICVSSGQDKIIGRINNMIDGQQNSVSSLDTPMTNAMHRVCYNYAKKPSMQVGMRILSTGHALTAEQMATYNSLCDDLIALICA